MRVVKHELFSWWKRWPLWYLCCAGELGCYFEVELLDGELVLGWCRDCGHCCELVR